MVQSGLVVSENDGKINVRVMRQSACEGCKQKAFCGGGCDATHEKPIIIEVKNTLGAAVGDRVELYSENRFVLGTTFLIFIFPLLFAFFLCGLLSQNGASETACLLGAAAGFVIPFAGLLYGMNRYVKKRPCVMLKRIVEKAQS